MRTPVAPMISLDHLPAIRVQEPRPGRRQAERVAAALESRPALVLGPQCTAEARSCTAVHACVDGSLRSDAIVPVAAALAAGAGLDLWLMTVVTAIPRTSTAAQVENLHANYLKRLAANLRSLGMTCNWDVLHDSDAARAITDQVHDGIIAATCHGQAGAAPGLGPVANALVRTSRVPLLLMRAAQDPSPWTVPAVVHPRPAAAQPRPRPAHRTRGVRCADCGCAPPTGARFCGHCGARLAGPRARSR